MWHYVRFAMATTTAGIRTVQPSDSVTLFRFATATTTAGTSLTRSTAQEYLVR